MGTALEVVAPGETVMSTGLFDGIVGLSGTSVATAQVAGTAAIIWGIDSNKSADFVRRLLVSTSRELQNRDLRNVGLIDVTQAISCYNEFEELYVPGIAEIQKLNDFVAEDFGDMEIIEALWTKDSHASIITGYINPRVTISSNNLTTMVNAAKNADVDYKSPSSALHGTGNYVKGLKYLYLVAKYVREGYSNASASSMAYSAIPSGGNDMVVNLKTHTEALLASSGSSRDDRYYSVLGFAMHCLGDTFAHRPYVYELDGFIPTDFPNYAGFKTAVNNKDLEYRYIKEHTSVALSKYEDNTEIGPNRFKNAKIKSLEFYKVSYNDQGYSAKLFEKLTYPLTLDKLESYSSSY